MIQPRNLHLSILLYLQKFNGDGQFHSLDQFFEGVNESYKDSVIQDLKARGLIRTIGGYYRNTEAWPIFLNIILSIIFFCATDIRGKNCRYVPLNGMLTFKGAEYLSKQLKATLLRAAHVEISNNSNSNIIFNSPSATISVTSAKDKQELVDKIINTVRADTNIQVQQRMEMVLVLAELRSEIRRGTVDKALLQQISAWSNIASIGSFVQQLLIGFGGT
ncbi:hypothetical protein [uncultured Pontibacter sp.]|uniref:hypothetical protein n=1 Tax=uncultured Pontibacter sp. TaxID=453356 RepID=UPI0026170FDA|nr:hypothetical protein [uncultured Pontibacter sp.]